MKSDALKSLFEDKTTAIWLYFVVHPCAQHMHVKNGCVHAPAYPQAKVKKEEYVEGHINL